MLVKSVVLIARTPKALRRHCRDAPHATARPLQLPRAGPSQHCVEAAAHRGDHRIGKLLINLVPAKKERIKGKE